MGNKISSSTKSKKTTSKQSLSFKPNKSKNEDNILISKRKKFRELIRLSLIKDITLNSEIKTLFTIDMDNYNNDNKNQNQNQENIENLKTRETTATFKSQYELYINDSNDVIRKNYYCSLIKNYYLYNNKNQKFIQNCIIFDWDDTIMCTTFISSTGLFDEEVLIKISKQKDNRIFNILEDLIYNILLKSLSKGHVFIVTNAISGWVEFSAKLFFPKIIPLLKKILIISARSWFEIHYPTNPRMWKNECFEEISKVYDPNKVTNLIVIGDSFIEMEAAYLFKEHFKECYVKTIKLKDLPSPELLIKQLKLIINDFDIIVSKNKSLTVSVQKDNKKKYKAKMNNSFKDKIKRSNTISPNQQRNDVFEYVKFENN